MRPMMRFMPGVGAGAPVRKRRLTAPWLAAWMVLTCMVPVLPVAADQVTAELTFNRRPPIAGLLYVPADGAVARREMQLHVDQRNKAFLKPLVVAEPGAEVVFLNSDDFDHNIYASDPALGVQFDFGLMPQGARLTKLVDWPAPSMLRIGCKIHPRMRTYVANIRARKVQEILFERRKLAYTVQMELPGDASGEVVLLLAGREPLRVKLRPGQEVVEKLAVRGREVGSATLRRGAGS